MIEGRAEKVRPGLASRRARGRKVDQLGSATVARPTIVRVPGLVSQAKLDVDELLARLLALPATCPCR